MVHVQTRRIVRFADIVGCACGGSLAPASSREVVCDRCEKPYHTYDGILLAGHDDPAEDEAKRREEEIRDRQAPLYDVLFGASVPGLMETRWAHSQIARRSPRTALDVGCGTGRMTLELARHSNRVVSVDRSIVSLQRCREKLRQRGLEHKVLLVKSDINSIPLRPASVDLTVTTQVIQHLPTEEDRSECVRDIARATKHDGTLVMTVYAWDEAQNYNREKEGEHKGGIRYFRFTHDELRSLLSPHFRVESVRSCLGKLLFTVGARSG